MLLFRRKSSLELMKPRILIIDDDIMVSSALERLLRDEFNVFTGQDPTKVLKELNVLEPELIICDYEMPLMKGLTFFETVKKSHPGVMRILITGRMQINDLKEAIQNGVIHRFFLKPWENDVLKLQLLEISQQYKIVKQKQQWELLAHIDPLTQIKNQRAFQEDFTKEIERTKRHLRPLSLLMIDIDFFKNYNDQFGHPEGDTALKEIAGQLQKSLRNFDSVYRYGGEEFTIILPDVSPKAAAEIAERLRSNIKNLKLKSLLTISLGVAYFKLSDTNSTLLQRADQALYQAKSKGRNQTCIAD